MAWNEQFERLRARLFNRHHNYTALFKLPGGDLGPAAEAVMRDLAHYCYADRSTLKISLVTQQADPIATAFAEGRRDVFLRISAMCNLNPQQIERIAHARTNDD